MSTPLLSTNVVEKIICQELTTISAETCKLTLMNSIARDAPGQRELLSSLTRCSGISRSRSQTDAVGLIPVLAVDLFRPAFHCTGRSSQSHHRSLRP